MDTTEPAPICYAEVAVDAPTPHHLTFTYAVPSGMPVYLGQAVWVPFGPKLAQGVVFEITPEPRVEAPRFLDSAVAGQPPLGPWQVDLARWMSRYYACSLFDAAALLMPPGFEQRVLTVVRPAPTVFGRSVGTLTPRERKLVRTLERQGPIALEKLQGKVAGRWAGSVTDQLVQKGLVIKEQVIQRPAVGPKRAAVLCLTEPGPPHISLERTPRQAELLATLEESGGRLDRGALRDGGFSAAVAAGLVQKGLAHWQAVRLIRDPLAHLPVESTPAVTLTPAQDAAWEALRAALDAPNPEGAPAPFLLFGVTGSGKTEVYLEALAHAVAHGRKGIVLVPEIALTPQTVGRFAARFPGRVAVLHSGLSLGQQFDEWWRIHDGEFDVVIGSRSAIFAPQPHLGLIIVDEEHEGTYKQSDPAPRYHARRVAEELAHRTGAVLVLGSATPDLASYAGTLAGRYRLLELPERAGPDWSQTEGWPDRLDGPSLAAVTVVDLRAELRAGNRSIFSRSLARELEHTLEQGHQAILFLNRRGTSSFVQCRDCGHAMTCRRCDVALTYHTAGERLVCHQCDARVPVPAACPKCSSPRIKFLGLGTERVEEEVRKLFPAARVLRWDRDTARSPQSHAAVLRAFQTQQGDILVGTQMIAKGLDLPRVTLVGVVNADVNLYLPDFRAAERTFQLLTQVAGRAGRGAWAGRVIIQTYTPEHYAIQAAAKQDYRLFYEQEIEYRRHHGYPPVGRMARLLFAHPGAAEAQREAAVLAHRLREEAAVGGLSSVSVIGPVPAFPRRLRGRYRWQIILLGGDPHPLLERIGVPRGWALDIDPVGLG